jgi:Tfp pilus assembly protein FimT
MCLNSVEKGRREFMEKSKCTLSIVDFLVGVAVLMILASLFLPHFVQSSQKGKAAEPVHRAATVRPGH